MPTSAASRQVLSPAEITRRSKSNIAFALLSLPAERRRDMVTYYAFCRAVDDIADDPDVPRDDKVAELALWSDLITDKRSPSSELEEATVRLRDKYDMPLIVFLELIEGMRMDLDIVRYDTWEELKAYCYRVAGVVGIACVSIFGYRNPQCLEYGVSVGYSLQITNILRDIHEDFVNDNRIYLPKMDMEAAGYTEDDVANKRYNEAFARLMTVQYERALANYRESARLLPPEDRTNMLSMQTMSRIYFRILEKMKEDGFRLYDKRYRVSQPEKLFILSRAYASRWVVG
jgi:phytoene synthase